MPLQSTVRRIEWTAIALLIPLLLVNFDTAAGTPPVGEACSAALGQSPLIADDQLAGELEILSWNIQKASNRGWASDLADVTSEIHLAFIQEASLQARIAQVIAMPLIQAFSAGYASADQETGVMTLSASTPSLHCNFTAWEPWLGTPKATSVTEYPLRGREDRLLAINLHAVNFTFGVTRLRQQLGVLAGILSKHQGPVIVAGDLNTWSGRRQALVDGFMAEYGLGPVGFEPDLRSTAFGRALDHVYIRGMKALAAWVIPVSSSDHNPLRVRLALL